MNKITKEIKNFSEIAFINKLIYFLEDNKFQPKDLIIKYKNHIIKKGDVCFSDNSGKINRILNHYQFSKRKNILFKK